MRKFLSVILLTAIMGSAIFAAPAASIVRVGEEFEVTYTEGAVWACTVFRMIKATEEPSDNFPDGHYAPRKCWDVEGVTSYRDNWNFIPPYNAEWHVYAEVGYPRPGDNGVTYVDYIETNRITVTH